MPSPPSASHSYSQSGPQQEATSLWLSRDPLLSLAGTCAAACGGDVPFAELFRPAAEQPRRSEPVSVHWSFPGLALHARLARAWFKALVKEFWPDEHEEAAYQAVQVFAEIIANAIEHGGGGLVTVCLRVSADGLSCEVGDGNPEVPRAVTATDDDEHHRGLALVCALLGREPDVRPTCDGKVVGFTICARELLQEGVR